MTIKIAHLYYDLMNLYGENGNVRALKRHFEYHGVKCNIHFLTINDAIDFSKYDIFYIGEGTEDSQILVLKDMLKRKLQIQKVIEDGKYFFITGNALELFGKYLIDFDGNKIDTLNIFPYYTKVIDFSPSNNVNFRIIGSPIGKTDLIDKTIIGFQNRRGCIYENNSPLFTFSKGTGSNTKEKKEGYIYKNFYATYLIGPLFIRNPYLTEYFIRKIIKEKDSSFKCKPITNMTEVKAYKEYLHNFEIE